MQSSPVYLFGTCLIDSFYPASGLDSADLLSLCGFQVVFPQDQTCCGQPPYNSGEAKAARDVAWHTIQIFSEHDHPLVVPSASCAGMIKHHYPTLFDEGSHEYNLAINLSQRTFEIIEFIAPLLPYEKQTKADKTTVSLHRSCSAIREMKVAEQWLLALDSIEGVEVVLPEQEAECCGFGGTFAIKSPDISAAMTEDKCRHLLSAKPSHIISGDCGCLMNIEGQLKFSGNETPCQHITRFIAQRFGINNE